MKGVTRRLRKSSQVAGDAGDSSPGLALAAAKAVAMLQLVQEQIPAAAKDGKVRIRLV